MPTDTAEFHQEATAGYDAAFDWYLEVRMRHSSLTLKWIGRRRRSLPLLTVGLLVRAQVPAPAVSVYSDVPGTSFDDSDRGDCPHQPEAGVLEGAIAAPRGLVKVRASHVSKTAKACNIGHPAKGRTQPPMAYAFPSLERKQQLVWAFDFVFGL